MKLVGLLLGLIIIVGAVWRYASRRWSLPCPWWAVPLLENPYMASVVGSSQLLQRADVREGMRVLDVGAGPGRVSLPAAERVGSAGEVVALDIQPEMVRLLERRIADRGISNLRAVLGGAGEGKVGYGVFDRALLVAVLGEIPDRLRALREIHDALKPGGLLSVTEVLPDPHYQGKALVRRLAQEIGFHFDREFDGLLAFTMNFSKDVAA